MDKATGKIPDFVLGYPFPKIDPKDPKAGCKIAWNFPYANVRGGGGATFTLNGIDTTGEFRRINAFIHAQTIQGSLNCKPAENPENIAGQGVTAASRSDPVGGLDIFSDDLNCYAGKVEYYQWKVVGEGKVLAPIISPTPFIEKQSPDRATKYDVDTPYLKAGYEGPGSKGVPWWIQENLVFIPRPVWIVEGQSTDPYYNFGKVVMYFDKELYRIYWKLVHNRAGEYFYTAGCGYHFVKTADDTHSSVFPSLVIGVNDKINRAALGGRYQASFIERAWDPAYFSLRTITHMSD